MALIASAAAGRAIRAGVNGTRRWKGEKLAGAGFSGGANVHRDGLRLGRFVFGFVSDECAYIKADTHNENNGS